MVFKEASLLLDVNVEERIAWKIIVNVTKQKRYVKQHVFA